MSARKTHTPQVARARLLRFLVVSASALGVAALLIMVRALVSPFASLDHSLAADLHSLVANQPRVRSGLQAITYIASATTLGPLVVAALIPLVAHRRFRLASYLVVAAAGGLALSPVLKIVAHPVAHGSNGFPSAHALNSIVCFGAVILAFLPTVPERGRRPATLVVGGLVAVIGISRVMLGVHYLSDVVGAWALGVAWLAITAYAFEIIRRRSGQPVTNPLTEGLEPEAATDLVAVSDRPAATPKPGRAAAGLAVAWLLILGVAIGFGELITHYGGNNLAGDHTIPHWLAAHRTPVMTTLSVVFSGIGETRTILAVAVLAIAVTFAVTRRWRPVSFVALVMIGEGTLFIITQAVIKRDRPDVVRLENHIPTTSYPSGHVAAAISVYVAMAILVFGHTRRWWRWPVLALGLLLPVLVAIGRMYRGMHHPTDVLGSALMATLLLVAVYRAIQPNADVAAPDRATRSVTRRSATSIGGPSPAAATNGKASKGDVLRRVDAA